MPLDYSVGILYQYLEYIYKIVHRVGNVFDGVCPVLAGPLGDCNFTDQCDIVKRDCSMYILLLVK